jgi:hypothetical protein
MFSLTAAMSGPLFVLRGFFGVLEEHNARQKMITTAITLISIPYGSS